MSVRVSRASLDRIRNSVRSLRVQYVEHAGAWHAIVPCSVQLGTYLIRCSGVRAWGRVAVDLPEDDVCIRCRDWMTRP